MRVTIVVDDNIVLVDGKARTVDCSPLVKDGTHAVQWHDVVGEVEFRNEFDMDRKMVTRKPNEIITDFSPYQSYVDAWQIENAKQTLIEEAQQRQIEEMQAAAKAEQQRLDEWMKLSPGEQQRRIEEMQAAANADQQRLGA